MTDMPCGLCAVCSETACWSYRKDLSNPSLYFCNIHAHEMVRTVQALAGKLELLSDVSRCHGSDIGIPGLCGKPADWIYVNAMKVPVLLCHLHAARLACLYAQIDEDVFPATTREEISELQVEAYRKRILASM